MVENGSIVETLDIQDDLEQIKALGNAIGALMIDEAQIDREHVGTLGYLVFHLVIQVEKKIDEGGGEWRRLRPEPQKAQHESGACFLSPEIMDKLIDLVGEKDPQLAVQAREDLAAHREAVKVAQVRNDLAAQREAVKAAQV